MPMLKAISGHTSTKGIRRYLTKKNRALAEDCLNLDPPEPGRAFDWAAAMDGTRRLFGNDSAWRGRRARTYKHYVVSPDPRTGSRSTACARSRPGGRGRASRTTRSPSSTTTTTPTASRTPTWS